MPRPEGKPENPDRPDEKSPRRHDSNPWQSSQEPFGSGGGGATFQSVGGSAPLGGFGKTFTGEESSSRASRSDIKRTSLADLASEAIGRGVPTDPGLLAIAERLDEIVQARVEQRTAELSTKLRVAERTARDLGGIANVALKRLSEAEERESELTRTLEREREARADVIRRVRIAEAAKQTAEERARVLEEENRKLRMDAQVTFRRTGNPDWDPKGYWGVLGVTDPEEVRAITSEGIERMFKAKSSYLHPDTPNGDTKRQQRLEQARSFLKDPLNRRSYGR